MVQAFCYSDHPIGCRTIMNSFITNSKDKKLKQRISDLIQNSAELKFLVGFFYFSGIVELYESLKKTPSPEMKVLVGLNVDIGVHGIIEYADDQARISEKERFERFLESVSKSINSDEFDCKEFYEQILFFIELIKVDFRTFRAMSYNYFSIDFTPSSSLLRRLSEGAN